MNTIPGILLIWTIFGTLYEEVNTEFQSYGCKDHNGKIHGLFFSWINEDCEVCHCFVAGMKCARLIARPIGYDKDKCEEIFDKESCRYEAVEKDNPSQSCDVSKYAF
ncbi:beta-microseminoprotein-like [Monodelphis domestica]|uniref:beta-microseminoprotein-like n=1 Tax=Monodelphis domestica TaxID=13616 RepID=UPI0024E19A9C|nr:beta-microseminoprotein-like [Monodelphis domestica]